MNNIFLIIIIFFLVIALLTVIYMYYRESISKGLSLRKNICRT